jgi:methyltransferase OMS1
LIAGASLYGITAYGTYLYKSYRRDVEVGKTLNVPKDVSSRYDETAEEFDTVVGTTEWVMGLTLLRRSLGKAANGDVLEIAAGTGRNMAYFDMGKVKTVTFLDSSSEMIELARRKFGGMLPVT